MKGGMQQLMRQANQMQNRMKKVQEELAEREYEASAGGGGVQVKLKGESQLISLTIDEEIFKEDKDMVEDLVITAVNEALKTAKDTSAAEMEKVTGGMSIPGMF